MTALAPSPVRRRPFVVPRDDVRWCEALAEALSVCCSGPSDARVGEVRALLASPPPEMLSQSWVILSDCADGWLGRVAECRAAGIELPAFAGRRLIEQALKNKPVPVQPWEERYP